MWEYGNVENMCGEKLRKVEMMKGKGSGGEHTQKEERVWKRNTFQKIRNGGQWAKNSQRAKWNFFESAHLTMMTE